MYYGVTNLLSVGPPVTRLNPYGLLSGYCVRLELDVAPSTARGTRGMTLEDAQMDQWV